MKEIDIKGITKSLLGSGRSEFKKALLLIFLLSIPVFVLNPGSEYTFINRFLAAIKAQDSVSIDIDGLSETMTEDDIVTMYPALKLRCAAEPSDISQRSCYSAVKNINGADGWFVVFFFNDKKLIQVKMDFTPSGHEEIMNILKSQYGDPTPFVTSTQPIPLVKWIFRYGILTTNKQAYKGRTTQLLWMSHEGMINQLRQKLTRQSP